MPIQTRAMERQRTATKYRDRTEAKTSLIERQHNLVIPPNEVEEVFREGFEE